MEPHYRNREVCLEYAELATTPMRLQIKVIASAKKQETVEMRIDPIAKVSTIKNSLCERFDLLPDNHNLCKKFYIDMPFLKSGKLGPHGRFEETGNVVGFGYAALDDSKTFAEQFESDKLERSYNNELALAWKPEIIIRCPICGLPRKSFTRNVDGYAFDHIHSELMICSNCKNADRVIVGKLYNEPVSQFSEKILWKSNNILITRKDSKIIIYELSGTPVFSPLTDVKVQRSRVYEISNSKLENISRSKIFKLIIDIIFNSKKSTHLGKHAFYHKYFLALKILGIKITHALHLPVDN